MFISAVQYYQAASEADAWMNDKAGIAANQDYGRDEDAAVKALKKHKVLQCREEKLVLQYQPYFYASACALEKEAGAEVPFMHTHVEKTV